MQATTNTRLNPLLAVAAVSVTVLSAVGVAALTGMIPATKSEEPALALPKEATPPAPKAAPSKPAVRKAAPKPVEPVVYREFAETPRVAQTPQVVEAPKPPQPLGQLAVVESVREVRDPGEAKGVGAIAGGVVGGVLGKKLGKGRDLATILGAAGGAFAGHQIEKHARGVQRWEIALRLEDGSLRTLTSEVQPAWQPGERVRLHDGRLLPA